MTPSPLELMRSRIACHYLYAAAEGSPRMLSVNQWNGGVAPRFYLGRTPAGCFCRCRADVPASLAAELTQLALMEPPGCSESPEHRDAYVHLLERHGPVEQVWRGPAFCAMSELPTSGRPVRAAVPVGEHNAHLLEASMSDWLPDVPHRHPFMMMIEDGQAVAVCASVRIGSRAHEAGVETASGYRRRGLASEVVSGWIAAVREFGAVPYYSTSWDNLASRRVAERLGLTQIGVDFHVT